MDVNLLVFIFSCILLIGFFAGTEIAFLSVNRINIELRKKQGTLTGRILGGFMEHPATFIGTSLVGVHLMLVLYGIKMTELNEQWFRQLPAAGAFQYLRLAVNTLIATAVILLFAELLPQAAFRSKAEQILRFFAIPMFLLYYLLYPLARIFVSVSEFILKYLFNVRIRENQAIFTRVDPEQFIRQSLHGHETEYREVNTGLFENALNLVHVKARKCMVPRNEVVAVEAGTSMAELRRRFITTKLSRMVVYEGTIDNITGYLYHTDLYRNPAQISDILHPVMAVPETMSAMDLMHRFSKDGRGIAWVIDEFGGTAGIVTMADVLEEIFGEIRDEYDVEEYVEQQIAAHEYIFSGRLELDYLNEKYGFDFPSETGSGTLSGYIISHYEAIPAMKERIIIGLYEFDILLVSDTRIETVKVKVLKSL